MAALILRKISKNYSKQAVLEDFSLEISEGEFLVLVGPSGCGKSTLIRSIAGLETIDSGEIFFRDQRIDTLAPKERHLSMVFQNYALYPHKTVYDNIAFPLTLRGVRKHDEAIHNAQWIASPSARNDSKNDPNGSFLRSQSRVQNTSDKTSIDSQVRAIAAKLELSDYLNRKPRELSGGQRQRVALARALIKNPEIFLLDEPLSNLDAKLRTLMRSEIHRLHQESGKIFIYVTHDQVEALTLADRIVVLNQGKIQQIGSPEEIYNNPANTFVASFIGSPPTNLITLSNKTLGSFSENFKAKHYPAILGIRPEHLSLIAPATEAAAIKVQLNSVELLGSELVVHTQLSSDPDCKISARLPLNAETRALLTDNIKISTISLYYRLSSLYYFDTISLSRLS